MHQLAFFLALLVCAVARKRQATFEILDGKIGDLATKTLFNTKTSTYSYVAM